MLCCLPLVCSQLAPVVAPAGVALSYVICLLQSLLNAVISVVSLRMQHTSGDVSGAGGAFMDILEVTITAQPGTQILYAVATTGNDADTVWTQYGEQAYLLVQHTHAN